MRRAKLLGRELLNKGKMNGYISNGDIFSTGHFERGTFWLGTITCTRSTYMKYRKTQLQISAYYLHVVS